jgi:hypothetical protein
MFQRTEATIVMDMRTFWKLCTALQIYNINLSDCCMVRIIASGNLSKLPFTIKSKLLLVILVYIYGEIERNQSNIQVVSKAQYLFWLVLISHQFVATILATIHRNGLPNFVMNPGRTAIRSRCKPVLASTTYFIDMYGILAKHDLKLILSISIIHRNSVI